MVVVADHYNHRLSLWRLDVGTVWKHLGSPGREPGQFTNLVAVAVTGAGALVVTDAQRVQVLTVDGAVLCVLDSTAVVGVGRLGPNLYGVSLYSGTDEILVTDYDNHRVVAMSWSPEVCFFKHCFFPPRLFFVGCIGFMMGSFVLLVLFSVAYWMRGRLAVKAHNWAHSTDPSALQSHQKEMCGW